MGRRISFSLQEALANPAVSINLSTEVLKGDPDAEPGSLPAQDTHVTTAEVQIKLVSSHDCLVMGFDLWFNDGRPELSCDFNGWGGQGAIQKFVDALGVAYHVC